MTEKFKQIAGNDGYTVSNLGNIKYNDELVPQYEKNGLLYVDLDGEEIAVDRLVIYTFFGKPPYSMIFVGHKDGNKLNNEICNLRYYGYGTNKSKMPTGEASSGSILTKKEVEQIREDFDEDVNTYSEFARKWGVSPKCISDIIQYKTWVCLYK